MKYLENIDKKNIKLLVFDLDGTLLDPSSHVTQVTRDALKRAADAGFILAVATGRVYTSFPEDIGEIPAIRYAISSNGAHIIDMKTGASFYDNLISEEAVRSIMDIIMAPEAMSEIFFEHQAYVSRYCYDHLEEFGIVTEKRKHYMRTTRKPVEDLAGLIEEHITELENVKLNYADYDVQLAVNRVLQENPGLTAICYQHLGYGIEIGGATTSKADALVHLCEGLGLSAENMMVFGDSSNDAPMLEAGGVSVAMGNAVGHLKEIADVICPSNEEDGIAVIIDELLEDR